MAKVYIEEWASIVTGTNIKYADVPSNRIAKTTLTIGGTSVRTSFDFDSKATYIILYADGDAQFELGDSTVEASGSSYILPSGAFRSFAIENGDTRVAVIEKQ